MYEAQLGNSGKNKEEMCFEVFLKLGRSRKFGAIHFFLTWLNKLPSSS